MVGKRRKLKLLVRFLLWSTPLLILGCWLFLSASFRHQSLSSQANELLLDSAWEEASQIFEGLKASYFQSRSAQLGFALCDLLAGKETVSSEARGRLLQEEVPLALLGARLFQERRFDQVLALAGWAGDSSELLQVYRVCALLELGRRTEALTDLSKLSSRARNSWLGRRIREVVTEMGRPATMIFDRRGKLIGHLTRGGEPELVLDADRSLITLSPEFLQEKLPESPSVRMSLDLELSRLAARALRGFRGSIVLVDPYSGEILAAVSDRESLRREGLPPYQQALEPASISKLITTTASLRAGIDPDGEIAHMRCRGAQQYEGDFLYCAYRAGELHGLNRALAVSCNIAFANLGLDIGRKHLIGELERFGFNRKSRFGVNFGKILKQEVNERELADLSIGLEYSSITPVHAALIAAAFANQGIMPEPKLVASTDGVLGLTPEAVPTRGARVFEQEWLPQLMEAMKAVVAPGGTAAGVAPADFPIAMKTGTARTPGRGYHTNYIGIGPLPNARVAFCVRITNQLTSRRVGRASYSVTSRLLRYLKKQEHLLSAPLRQESERNRLSQMGPDAPWARTKAMPLTSEADPL